MGWLLKEWVSEYHRLRVNWAVVDLLELILVTFS